MNSITGTAESRSGVCQKFHLIKTPPKEKARSKPRAPHKNDVPLLFPITRSKGTGQQHPGYPVIQSK